MVAPDFIQVSPDNQEKIKLIKDAVAEHFNLTWEDITARNCNGKQSRIREVIVPRQVTVSAVHDYTNLSLSVVAREMNIDHATVIHCHKTVHLTWWNDHIYGYGPKIQACYDDIESRINFFNMKLHIKDNDEPVSEYYLQAMVCMYLRSNYPNVVFFSDMSGVRLTPGVAAKIKALKSGRGIPDLFIMKPSHDKKYGALCLELKVVGNSPYKKDGMLRNEAHIIEQNQVINNLIDQGYRAQFSVGLKETIRTIDAYLKG